MDNLSHTLTAIALSHAGLSRKTRFATLAVIVGANIPDIDLITRVGSTATYLKYHRGITHSLLGVIVLGTLVGLVTYYWGRRAPTKESSPAADLGWLVCSGVVGAASHLLLDFSNAYGVRPFLPFSGRWYSWDIMFIIEPLLLLLLALGLGVPLLLRLISEEVGAHKPRFRAGAIFALSAMALLWGVRDLAHRRVLSLLDSHTYAQENPRRVGAFPVPVNPFAWTGVVETESAFHVLSTSALDDDINADDTTVFRKAEPTPALEAAMKTRAATIFLDFARFPWGQAEEQEDGYDVTLRDLRFISFRSDRRAFVVEVELDKNLGVRSESFSFVAPERGVEPQRSSEGEERGESGEAGAAGRAMSR